MGLADDPCALSPIAANWGESVGSALALSEGTGRGEAAVTDEPRSVKKAISYQFLSVFNTLLKPLT